MKKSTTRVTLVIIIMIIGVVGYYTYLSNRHRTLQEETAITPAQETLSRDLSIDYPPTPKEVVKYYNEILKCFYNEDCTEEEIEALGAQARELYDEELLANNEYDTYLVQLKADIQEYKDQERKITSIPVASSTSVDYYTKDGYSFARIMCGYNVMEGTVGHSASQVYLLRRDENKKWKIYGWMSLEEYNATIGQ